MGIAVNRVIIAGYLPRDIELRYTPGGDAIGNFSVAVNATWTGKDGEKKEKASFIDCTAFGKQAETASKYLEKGSPVLVDGRLDQDTWEDKDTGKSRSKLKVICDRIQFLSSGPTNDEDRPKPAGKKPTAKSKPAKRGHDYSEEDTGENWEVPT